MSINLSNHWYIAYLLTLFSFNVVPGVSFVTTIKNTIENKSFKVGMFTALGIATADLLAGVLGYFFCATLEMHKMAFKYARMIGMMYLLYVGIKMMASKREGFSTSERSLSNSCLDAYKSGFLYNFSNIGMITITISVVSQYYKYVSAWYGYVNLIISVPLVSFTYFTAVAFLCNFLNLRKLFEKRISVFDKVAGFVIIVLASTNIKSILFS